MHLIYGRRITSLPYPLVESDKVSVNTFGNVGVTSTSPPSESSTKVQEATRNP